VLEAAKGILMTVKTALRKPVTIQYPKQHAPIPDRYMGFPALTWDHEVGEPYCVGCMVCVRNCPTQCMSGTMMDNPLRAEGKSTRRKMVQTFEINLSRCILCRICVEVCNFDAIEMSHEHEISTFTRGGRRVDLPLLLEMGRKYQRGSAWQPPSKKAKAPATARPATDAAPAAEAAAEAPEAEEETT
jgi:NADH-quinone oxidoreductase subunit I